VAQHRFERAGLPGEAAGNRAREAQAASSKMFAEPRRLLQAESGDRVVMARKVRLRVADQVELGHA
jgi:hypothetical protein